MEIYIQGERKMRQKGKESENKLGREVPFLAAHVGSIRRGYQ